MPSDRTSTARNGSGSTVPRYIVITPARDEAENISDTIISMKRQTILPSAWYIVDDGSSDATASIVQDAVADAPWIHLISREDRGYRVSGADVQSFFVAYEQIADSEWDYVVKLDADVRFADDYFSSCLRAFELDETLGIAGGTIYNLDGDERIPEKHPAFHVRGATKIYRRACWEDIGGLAITPAWDTIDEVSANMHGWTTRTLPDVPIDHLRPTGDGFGQWTYWVKNGRAAYLVGYHPLFLLARAILRVTRPPYLVGTVGLIWGYFRSVVSRQPRDVGDDLARYVHEQQWNRLTGRETVWK
jgi:biofilm PGA synthesis N-glycosyltransferase PgaC